MILDYLLCIYNYVSVQYPPMFQITLNLVESYPPIEKLIRRLYFTQTPDYDQLEQTYFLLNQFITKQQQILGPKRFKKLIHNVFTILTQYILNLSRSKQHHLQQVFFHLTYYKKNCGKFIDHFYAACIVIFYIICNLKMGSNNSIHQKIQQCRNLVKNFQKQKEFEKQSHIFMRLCALLEAIVLYKQLNLKKSKDLASKIINYANLQFTQCIRLKRQPSLILKLQLILSSLTVSQIYKEIGKYELHVFLINKCIEYSEKFLQCNQQFLIFLNVDKMEPMNVKMKLTRLQQKIRRVQLAQQEEQNKMQQKKRILSKTLLKKYNQKNQQQKFNQLQKLKNVTNKLIWPKIQQSGPKKSSTFHYATLRQAQSSLKNQFLLSKVNKKNIQAHQIGKIDNDKQSQLKNILIVKDKKKNYFKLKQQTLKYLNKENYQLKKHIKFKTKQIQKIKNVHQELEQQLDIGKLKTHINSYKQYEGTLIKQIQNNKWKYLAQIPAVKKLNSYFKTFIQTTNYWHSKNVYSLVYGEILGRSQLKMISKVRRKINGQDKQVINQIKYNQIKHQVEYIKQNKDNNQQRYFISIYEIQKVQGRKGINQQIEITQEEYKIMKYQAFYFFYSFINEKLIPIQQHLRSLSLGVTYRIKSFISYINRFSRTKGKIVYKKIKYNFNYKKQNIQNQHLFNHFHLSRNKSLNKKTIPIQISAIFLLKIQQKPQIRQKPKTSQKTQLQQQQSIKQKIEIQQKPQTLNVNSQKKLQQKQQNSFQSKVSICPGKKRQLQITIQKISIGNYYNSHYNFKLIKKIANFVTIQDNQSIQYDSLIHKVMLQKMNQIWSGYSQQIICIQKHFRRKISQKKLTKRRQQYYIQTHIIRNTIYTLSINNSNAQTQFFIQNYDPKYPKTYQIFIKNDVSFKDLQFLQKMEDKLEKSNRQKIKDKQQSKQKVQRSNSNKNQPKQTLDDLYWKIQKYLKIKHFATKIFFKSKNIRLFTDFQTQFKKKLCFATVKNQFLFRGKMRQGKIMYMLTVKQFSKIPRPYSLRIFTLDSNSIVSIDAQKTIYNKQKLFLESKIGTVNQVIQILSRNQFEIFAKAKVQAAKKVSSRISILSNYSFQSGGDSSKDYSDDKGHNPNIMNRRMSKNSMFTKFRHKALIKNQDLEAIKKMVQDKNLQSNDQNSSDSESSPRSKVSSVISARSSQERQSME